LAKKNVNVASLAAIGLSVRIAAARRKESAVNTAGLWHACGRSDQQHFRSLGDEKRK
jgi:hypothetical protein